MVKASTTSIPRVFFFHLLESVATLLKVLIAQELIIQCDFDFHESHTFNHTHIICNIARARNRGGGGRGRTSSMMHMKRLHSILRYVESSRGFTEIKQVSARSIQVCRGSMLGTLSF